MQDHSYHNGTVRLVRTGELILPLGLQVNGVTGKEE